MITGVLRSVAVATIIAAAAACGRSDVKNTETAPVIQLVPSRESAPARIEVTGLPANLLEPLRDREPTSAQWAELLRVSVSDDAPAMLGAYQAGNDRLTFTPAFPFDPGREYAVRFDSSKMGAASREPLLARVALPSKSLTPSTVVQDVYPSGNVVPANLLRLYIEFSAPMGHGGSLEHLVLLDDAGKVVKGAFLPLDYEFWSPDRRRLTAFFDPGRVKDGILPNQQLGRPLRMGRSYTLVVQREWMDGEGQPLKEEFRRVFTVGPARTEALDPATWTITPPRGGGRTPLVVAFPESLDRGLLMRALGVRQNGVPVPGDVRVEPGERQWIFTPHEAWRAGRYDLLALSILEDVAGNQIGRAFEVTNFDAVDKDPDPKTVLLPFTVPAATS